MSVGLHWGDALRALFAIQRPSDGWRALETSTAIRDAGDRGYARGLMVARIYQARAEALTRYATLDTARTSRADGIARLRAARHRGRRL